ncbi:MAG: hypothetical protein DDT27_00808 [Dehalococcoidia bacterium]|nr:hypothetical protein [Chloroflexota bacterium]
MSFEEGGGELGTRNSELGTRLELASISTLTVSKRAEAIWLATIRFHIRS